MRSVMVGDAEADVLAREMRHRARQWRLKSIRTQHQPERVRAMLGLAELLEQVAEGLERAHTIPERTPTPPSDPIGAMLGLTEPYYSSMALVMDDDEDEFTRPAVEFGVLQTLSDIDVDKHEK